MRISGNYISVRSGLVVTIGLENEKATHLDLIIWLKNFGLEPKATLEFYEIIIYWKNLTYLLYDHFERQMIYQITVSNNKN